VRRNETSGKMVSYAYDPAVRDILLHAQVIVEVRQGSGGLCERSAYVTVEIEGS
jgi:hypothetical protein